MDTLNETLDDLHEEKMKEKEERKKKRSRKERGEKSKERERKLKMKRQKRKESGAYSMKNGASGDHPRINEMKEKEKETEQWKE